ncbi:MAG: DUF4097 family beta strand repeat-containing protein [Pseudomonadota bacterium]
MKTKNKTILTLAALLVALPAAAGEEVRRSLPTGDAPDVRIISPTGDIVVMGESTTNVEIVAELANSKQRLEVSERGNEVLIEISKSGGWQKDHGTDLVVTVPRAASVVVEAASADINVEGVRGTLRVATASGDVDVETFGGKLKARSTSGDVVVTGHMQEGEAWVGSTSGDVDVSELAGRLSASSVSGDVAISDGQLDRVRATATSGDIYIQGLRGKNADIEADAVSGDIDITLGSAFGGRIEVSTLNGRIDNCFGPKPQRTSRYGPGRILKFDHGTGSGRLELETVNGGIEICME